jgi:nicotinate phosphoribosyltransferase
VTWESWRYARAILDDAGLPDARIVASGGLDEYAVDELVRSGAPIDVYAVGTRVGVSADTPYLDSTYKMVESDDRPVMKLSSAKVTAPGQKQVFRRPCYADMIGLADEQLPKDGVPEEIRRRSGRAATSGPADPSSRRASRDGLPATERTHRPCPAPHQGGASPRGPGAQNEPHPDHVGPHRGKTMPHTAEWKVRLYLFEEEGTTKARVVLDSGTAALTGHGVAHRNPADMDVPEIGDELAAGRAMHDLAQQLVDTA